MELPCLSGKEWACQMAGHVHPATCASAPQSAAAWPVAMVLPVPAAVLLTLQFRWSWQLRLLRWFPVVYFRERLLAFNAIAEGAFVGHWGAARSITQPYKKPGPRGDANRASPSLGRLIPVDGRVILPASIQPAIGSAVPGIGSIITRAYNPSR